MGPRFGYGAIGWRETLVGVVRELAGLGYQGVEVFGLLEPLKGDEHLDRALPQHGIQVGACYFAGSFVEDQYLNREHDDFHKTLHELKRLGGKYVVIGGGRIRPNRQADDWRTLVRTLSDLGRTAADHDVQLTYHPHMGTLVCNAEEIRRLADETDPKLVKFCFDTAHLFLGGSDPVKLFEQYMDRITHVHFKDVKDGLFVELGEGDVPISQIYRTLREQQYEGWIIVELDSTPDAKKSAAVSRDYLRRTLGVKFPF